MSRSKTNFDTLDLQAEAIEAAKSGPVLPPPGCTLTDREMEVWENFVGIRLSHDWRPYDLMLLARACRLEIAIRDASDQLDEEGFLVETQKGLVSNPIIRVLQSLNTQQLSILRHVGMVTASVANLNDKGDKVNRTRKNLNNPKDKVDKARSPRSLLVLSNDSD